jgi:Holliday junction resolvase|tara:strand:+ start:14630 stop:15016 length:387 start_codon:yes stop_codon:yes gene_type:complete
MAKEAELWKLIRKNFPKEAHVQRIETGGTGRGVPDVNYCQEGKEIWIELKSIKGNKLTLSPFQMTWIHNRIRSGGNCAIVVRKDKTIKVFIPEGLEEIQELTWNSDAQLNLDSPYDWPVLFNFLLSSF